MSALAALLIFGLATVLAAVLALPIISWLRRKRRKQNGDEGSGVVAPKLTALQALPGLILVGILATAFASEYVVPGSWFGQRISGWEGKVWFFIFVYICVAVIERTLRAFIRKRQNTLKP